MPDIYYEKLISIYYELYHGYKKLEKLPRKKVSRPLVDFPGATESILNVQPKFIWVPTMPVSKEDHDYIVNKDVEELAEIKYGGETELVEGLPVYETVITPHATAPLKLPTKEIPYEDFVRFVYTSLKRYKKMPRDLYCDILNELARELYEAIPDIDSETVKDFHLDFSDSKKLGKQLRELRERAGIRLRELSRVGVYSYTFLHAIEEGKWSTLPLTVERYLFALSTAFEKKKTLELSS